MLKLILIFKFIIIEAKTIKRKIYNIIFFIKNVSIYKFIIYLLDKNKDSIFRNNNLNKYLQQNKRIWKSDHFVNKQYILIDLSISTHPMYAITQCILGNNLKKITGFPCKAIINENDILTKLIAKSFNVNDVKILKKGNFFQRFYYFLKSINIINHKNIIKKLYFLKKNNIEIGKSAYEYAVRNYIKNLPSKKNIHLFYYALSKSLQVLDQTNKIFNSRNIALLVMAEIQFIPNRIFFQKSLMNKIPVYSYYGGRKENYISICCFDNKKSFNKHRMKFSYKLLNFLIKNFKNDLIKLIDKFLKDETKSYQVGFGEKIYYKTLPKKKLLKFKNYDEFCKEFNLNKNLKTILILPNVFVDNLLTHDWGIFPTPIEWYLKTIEYANKIKNVNWIIKPHPSEKIYNTNITARNLFFKDGKKQNKIKFINENYNIDNLSQYISTVISFGGSAGYEYTRLGIPVITAGDTRYSNFKLTKSPKNLREYEKILNNLNKQKKVNKEIRFKAGLYWLLIKKLTRIQNNLIPITLTRRNNFSNSFWDLALKTISKNKYSNINKIFLRELEFMYKYKNRHSIQFNELRKFNKKISFKLNDINSD